MFNVIIKKYKVKKSQIFVTGWSNGATMTYRLVCEMSDMIAAAVPFLGAPTLKIKPEGSCNGSYIHNEEYNWNITECDYDYWINLPEYFPCKQEKEVPLLIINGRADKAVHYFGYQFTENFKSYFPPVSFGPYFFRELYGCNPLGD